MPTHTGSSRPSRSPRYWIEVIELTDPDLPRRHPDRENLKVGITRVGPGDTRESRWNTKRLKDPGTYGELRNDLMPTRSTATQEDANRRKRETINRLRARGYTVNRDTTVWSVYVIELDSLHLPECPGYFYVGQTSKAPETRVEEHRLGKRNSSGPLFSRDAKRYFKGRREDKEPKRTYFTRDDALKAESALRRKLEARGYTVAGGTEMLDQ